jgi:hypothetical protein
MNLAKTKNEGIFTRLTKFIMSPFACPPCNSAPVTQATDYSYLDRAPVYAPAPPTAPAPPPFLLGGPMAPPPPPPVAKKVSIRVASKVPPPPPKKVSIRVARRVPPPPPKKVSIRVARRVPPPPPISKRVPPPPPVKKASVKNPQLAFLDQIKAGNNLKKASVKKTSVKKASVKKAPSPFNLMEELKAGNKNLKKASIKKISVKSGPLNLADQLKAGKVLKKVSVKRAKSKKALSPLEMALAARRKASNEDEEADGEDWV